MSILGSSIDVKKIGTTVSGIAESIQGNVEDFRGVLDANTQLSPFTFPPSVEAGLKVAGQLGITIPSASELQELAQGYVDKYTGGLLKDINSGLDVVDGLLGKVTSVSGDIQDELSKLTWLL